MDTALYSMQETCEILGRVYSTPEKIAKIHKNYKNKKGNYENNTLRIIRRNGHYYGHREGAQTIWPHRFLSHPR